MEFAILYIIIIVFTKKIQVCLELKPSWLIKCLT
jgi:hypothetical protein